MDTNRFSVKKMSAQFLVNDIERSIGFYTKKLGFAIDFRYEDFYAGISKDGCSIHLKSGKTSTEERNKEDLNIIFLVDDVERIYESLKGSVEVIQPLRVMPYGKEFYSADPDGYVICFLESV